MFSKIIMAAFSFTVCFVLLQGSIIISIYKDVVAMPVVVNQCLIYCTTFFSDRSAW